MPAWVDLSEHQVSLNVYNSPDGKRLILRPLTPQSQIPPDVTELGFEPRGDAYERRDLQFSLPQLRKYFPKAVSREFAVSEIFFRPEEPSASNAIERYQWKRNRAGGQAFGNRQEVRSLTEALFNEHVKPGLRPEYAATLTAYRAKQPAVTHCSLVQVAGTGEWRLDSVGSLEECRPNPKNPAWVRKIDDFFSQEATDFGAMTDDDARPQYRDGRTIPIEGNEVVDVRGGFGGSAVYLNGKVISRRGALRVQITNTTGFFGETASATTEPLSNGWTIKGEEHPHDRQLRQSRERDEQWRQENEAREAGLRAQAEASKVEGYPHLDMIDPAVGTRIEEIDSGRTGTIIEYFELGDAQEPVVLFDDEPAGSSGVTIGNKAHRYRYRVIAAAPTDAIEETVAPGQPEPSPQVDHAAAIHATARAPWQVPKKQFIESSRFLVEEDGHGRVIFDDVGYRTEEASPKKGKEEVHARLVKDTLYGRNAEPFPPSLPAFEVMLDYPNLVYQLNQRAEKNVSRLLAQLGVAGKLLAGEDGYLKVENPPYTDLVIERLPDPGGDRLYLTHYLRINGDSVLNAEMVFSIRQNGTLRLAETATQNPFRGGELRGRDVSFANMFSKNLLDQGFGVGKVLWPHDDRVNEDAIPETSATTHGSPDGNDESDWEIVSDPAGMGRGLTAVRVVEDEKGSVEEWIGTFGTRDEVQAAIAAYTEQHAAAPRAAPDTTDSAGNAAWVKRGMDFVPAQPKDSPYKLQYKDASGTIRDVAIPFRQKATGIDFTHYFKSEEEAIAWAKNNGYRIVPNPAISAKTPDAPIDPISPDGYARVLASDALQLEYQDTLDAFFAERIVAVRNALRDRGWKDDDAPAILKKNIDGVIASATIDTRQVGAGRNVVGIIGKVYTLQSGEIQSVMDDLTGTAEQLAGRLDEAAVKAELAPAPMASPADLYAADLMDYWVKLGKEPNRDLATQRAREFFEAISTRNVDELIDGLRPSLSPLSRTWFEKVTGVSIGRTWKETKNAIRAWAGEAAATMAPPSQATALASRITEIASQLPAIASKGIVNLDALMAAFNDARAAQGVALRAAPGQEAEFEQYVTDKLKALNDAYAAVLGETAAHSGSLPDYLRGVEGSLAREAWDKSCAEHEASIKRVIDGYWQMARAVWHSPAGESAFPDHVKTAIQTVGDTLRFGYPSDWSFDGALAHLFKAGDKLAQELENADIELDAGFRHGQRHSNASYRDDAARYETLREKTIKGTAGGLIAFGDAIIVNIDDSPLSRFAKAYKTYLDRIDAEIQRLSALAAEKDKSDAAQAESAQQAKFTLFDPASIRMPTAIQLGLHNKFQTHQGEPLLRLIPGGWSNGHVLDIGKRPILVTDAIAKYYGDETNPDLRKAEQKDIDRIVNQAKAAARIKVEPIAAFDDEFVEQGAIKGSGLNMKREKDTKMAINAVVLADESAGVAVQLDRRYYAYFATAYKGCEFLTSHDGTGAVLVRLDEHIVGVAMPIRVADDMKAMLERALAARTVRQEAAVLNALEPEDDEEAPAAGTTRIAELSPEEEVRQKILDDKQQKVVTVLEAAGIFEEAVIAEDHESASRLYGQAKDMLNKARASNIARDLIRDLPIVAHLTESKARVEAVLARYGAKKTEISRMRQSRKKEAAYEQAQTVFEAEIAGVDAVLARIGTKYTAERLPNLAIESAIEMDFIAAADDGGKLREAYDKANNSERKAWDRILALRSVETGRQAAEVADRITADNLDQYLTATEDVPQVDYIRFADIDPSVITLENIRGYGRLGTVEVNEGFGRTAGRRFGTLTVSRPVEDVAGVVRDSLTVKVSSDGKQESKYGLINTAWKARNDTALLRTANQEEREFLADINRAHFRHRHRGLALSSVASILNLLHGVEDVRGAANYGFALAEIAGNNLKGDYADKVKAAFAAHQAKNRSPQSAPAAAAPAIDANQADTVVWNGKAVPRNELAQFRNTVLAMIADANQVIETARKGKQRGDSGVIQRMQAKVADRQDILRRIDEALGQANAAPVAAAGKVKVYGASDSAEIAIALKEVISIARANFFTEKGAREYADSASRGELSTSQRELGTSELVIAGDRLHEACMANVALVNSLTETLNGEIATEERQAAGDPAFRVQPLPESLALVARNQILEVRGSNPDSGHIVTVTRLPWGQYKAQHGSAESTPTSLLTAVRWASKRLDELLAADRHAQESAEHARQEMDDQCRQIKCYVDGFRQFIPIGQSLDRNMLMEAIQPFTSAGIESTTRHTMSVPRFLSSGAVRSFALPDVVTLELAGENALRISVAGYTCEIQGTEPAPEFSEDRPWIRRDYERNAPMSFVGALSSACAWLKENQAWEDKKATYPDGGQQVEMLARQYAAFLHEAMPTHHDGGARDMHRSFAVAIMDKEIDYLMGWIARGRGQNDLSKKFFTKATGCKLPATIRDITATLYAWVGFTPEQAATREAEKEADRETRLQAKRLDDEIRWSGNSLSSTRVNHEGEIKTAKEFMDEILGQGYTEIRKYKAGAVDRYALVNPEIGRSYLIKGKMVDYARAVLAKKTQEKLAAAEEEEETPEAAPHHALRS